MKRVLSDSDGTITSRKCSMSSCYQSYISYVSYFLKKNVFTLNKYSFIIAQQYNSKSTYYPEKRVATPQWKLALADVSNASQLVIHLGSKSLIFIERNVDTLTLVAGYEPSFQDSVILTHYHYLHRLQFEIIYDASDHCYCKMLIFTSLCLTHIHTFIKPP